MKGHGLTKVAKERGEEEQKHLPAYDDHHQRRTSFGMRTFSALALFSVALTWALMTISVHSTDVSSQGRRSDPAFQSVYTAPSGFPTHAFSSYYAAPTDMKNEPRPAITDFGSGGYFSQSVDQPFPLQTGAPSSEAVLPKANGKAYSAQFASQIEANITTLLGDNSTSTCSRCIQALKLGQRLARAQPKAAANVMVDLCTKYKYTSTASGLSQAEVCKREYANATLGGLYTQVLSYANLTGDTPSDAQYICYYVLGSKSGCPAPKAIDLHANGFLDQWFGGKQARDSLIKRNEHVDHHDKRSGPPLYGKRGKKKHLRMLHFSDIHVDPRFFVNGEAACTSGQCCRSDSFNSSLSPAPPSPAGSYLPAANISEPAHYWGNYHCDSPWPLAVSAMQSVKHLNGGKPVDMTLYTGDMVTHDSDWHLSHDLVRYTQQAIFDAMKHFLGHGPVFSAIGNHDTALSDQSSQNEVPDEKGREAFSYDWANLARLFEAEGWFSHAEAKQVKRHYGGYSISPRTGLRIITLNTDFWYKGNKYNFINTHDPDYSGILRFLTDELHAAERRGERVWIVGHILTGWDGTNPLPNPTNLFYQIVDHFAPRTIAHIFFGHTHEDQFNVFYTNNGTERSAQNAKAVSFMAPSITPGTNVNSAVRIYSIDPETYEVHDYDQFYTQVNDFAALPNTDHGPVWQHLYSAREAYGNFSASAVDGKVANGTVHVRPDGQWPNTSPLNATFWSALTEEMERRPELVSDVFHHYQGRNSPRTKACNATCVEANICYMRSGSVPIGLQCPQGYGSVQGS
jgi:hypothetical protein